MTAEQNSTTILKTLLATQTPAERAAGRFLRAPDHGDGGDGGGDGSDADDGGDKSDAGDAAGAGDSDQDGGGDDVADAGKGDDGEGADKSLMTGGKGPDDEDDKGDDDGKADEQLPDKYELTPPEGFEINDEILAEVTPVFKDLKLNNDQANKVLTLAKPFAERLFAQQNDAFQAQASDWAKKAKKDSEIGGRNWSETESLVAKALDRLEAPQDFRDLLDTTKLGNHPEMIRMFRRIGAAIGEDGLLPRSDTGAPVKTDRLATLYPNDVPQKEGAN